MVKEIHDVLFRLFIAILKLVNCVRVNCVRVLFLFDNWCFPFSNTN